MEPQDADDEDVDAPHSNRDFVYPDVYAIPTRSKDQMSQHTHVSRLHGVVKTKPLQTAKFVGILLALVFAIAGFFRILEPGALTEGPMLLDGQFLALILLPLVSLGLVLLVSVETLVSGYRSLRSERALRDQIDGRVGYLFLRGAEAGLALLGVLLMAAAVPPLLAESTPAPAGVGIMLLLFVIALAILCVSFVRSAAELFVYGPAA